MLKVGGGAFLSQALTFGISPILTRLYSPEDFGVLAIYASLFGILFTVSTLKYEGAIALPRSDALGANVVAVSLFTNLAVSAVVLVVVAVAGGYVEAESKVAGLAHYLWFLPPAILLGGLYQTMTYWALRHRAYGRIGRTRLSQGVGQVIFQLGLGVLRDGPLGLVTGHIAGRASGSLLLTREALKHDGLRLRRIRRSRMWLVAQRYRRFPLLASWGGLLNGLSANILPLVLATVFGVTVAGWYGLAQRSIGLPSNLVSSSVGQVYFGEAAELIRSSPERLTGMSRRVFVRLALACVIPTLVIVAFGEPIFGWVFGPEWRVAGVFASILVIMNAIQFVTVPIANFHLVERQDLALWWNILRVVAVTAALGVAVTLDWSPHAVIATFAAAMAGAYLLLLLLYFRTIARLKTGPTTVPGS